jgi:OOP family OmpA-OmpF porin
MIRLRFRSITGLLFAAVLTACGGTPHTPVVTPADPIDTNAYARKVDTFVVLLDASGSMNTEEGTQPRMNTAEDWTASFNKAIPAMDFKAAMVTYGKGASGSCIGPGVSSTLVDYSTFSSAEFAAALDSLKCAASTTPIADAIDRTTGLLAEDKGLIALIIVSDFNFSDPAAVSASLEALKAQHPNNVCVHTVKVGSDTTHDAVIASLADPAGCDSSVAAADVAGGAALTTYVANTLLTPLEQKMEYKTYSFSAEVLFDFDKYDLKPQGRAELQRLGAEIRSQGVTVGDIDVVGHTDSVGSDEYNMKLSLRRAGAVRDYLVSQGVNPGLIDVVGMGKRQPIATNATAEGRALNRRVEVRVGTTKGAK